MAEKVVDLAPPTPRVLFCIECRLTTSTRKHPGERVKLRFLRSVTEQWGCVRTRHNVYRCPGCKDYFVSTNGRTPQLAADWLK